MIHHQGDGPSLGSLQREAVTVPLRPQGHEGFAGLQGAGVDGEGRRDHRAVPVDRSAHPCAGLREGPEGHHRSASRAASTAARSL
jgi:hypothetical protein